MIVKGESAVVQLPELDFEIPARQGQITTVESIIQQAISNLELDQPYRLVCSIRMHVTKSYLPSLSLLHLTPFHLLFLPPLFPPFLLPPLSLPPPSLSSPLPSLSPPFLTIDH